MSEKFYIGKLQYDPADLTMHAVVNDVTELPILLKKTDVYINLFGVAWMPYYQVQSGGQMLEIAAF